MRHLMRLPLLLLLLHLHSNPVTTNPIVLHPEVAAAADEIQLHGRSVCAIPCGFSSQLCCSAGYACYTDQNNDAQCSAAAFIPTPTTTAAGAASFVSTATSTIVCNGNIGQVACVNTCCNSGQSCLAPGQCSGATATPAPVASVPASSPAPVTDAVTTAPSSVPGTAVVPATVTTTAAVATVTAVAVGNSGLDSGSIAGIVIGVLVGILVLGWMFQPLMKKPGGEKNASVVSRSSRGYGSRRSKR